MHMKSYLVLQIVDLYSELVNVFVEVRAKSQYVVIFLGFAKQDGRFQLLEGGHEGVEDGQWLGLHEDAILFDNREKPDVTQREEFETVYIHVTFHTMRKWQTTMIHFTPWAKQNHNHSVLP